MSRNNYINTDGSINWGNITNNIDNSNTIGGHKVFVEFYDPTTDTNYMISDKDIWFDLTNKVIKYYSNGWKVFGADYL